MAKISNLSTVGKESDFDFDLKGVNAMVKRLDKIATKTARMAPSRAVRAGGKEIINEMKSNVSVDTGRLRKNIKQVLRRYPKQRNVSAIIGAKYFKEERRTDPGVYIFFNEYMGPKFGTKHRPFAKSSFEKATPRAKRAVVREIQKVFDQEAKRNRIR